MSTRLILVGIAAVSLAGVAVAALSVTGAGATFPYPIYSKWFYEYHKLHPDVEINYKSLGSTAGIEQVTAGKVDFGASDGPMNDQQVLGFKQQRQCDVLHFPTVLGAVVPTYHLPGATTDLNFTPAALAGIFLGKITSGTTRRSPRRTPRSTSQIAPLPWCTVLRRAAQHISGPTTSRKSARNGNKKWALGKP